MTHPSRFSGPQISLIVCLFLSGASPALAFDPAHIQQFKDTGNCEECDLSGADFSGQRLVDRSLSGANLSGANFSGADLTDTYLSNANLKGADLRKANLINTKFYGADLEGADLREATIDVDFVGTILSDAKLQGAFIKQTPSFAIWDKVDVLNAPGFVRKYGKAGSCFITRGDGNNGIERCRKEGQVWK